MAELHFLRAGGGYGYSTVMFAKNNDSPRRHGS